MNQTNFTVYLKKEEKAKIEKASELVGLANSAFCRNSAIERANIVLKQNEGVKNGN